MDTQYVGGPAGLVYHHTSPFFDHHPRPFPLVHHAQQPMSWQPQQAQTSPPNSSASTSSSLGTPLYSTVEHTADNIDYPSASAPLTQPRSANGYASPSVGESSRPNASFESPQIASSAGPSRLTRRRARTTVQGTSRSYNVCITYILYHCYIDLCFDTNRGVHIPWPLLVRALAHLPLSATPLRHRM